MKKYRQYYKTLKLRKELSEKTIYGFLLSTLLAVAFNDFGFSGMEGFSVIGPSFVLLISIFAVGFSQAQALNEPDVLFRMPFTAKERVKYYYIHIFVVFSIGYLVFVVLLWLLFLMLSFLSASIPGIEILPSEEGLIHYAGDLYSLAFTLFQFALYSSIGFIKSSKKRYLFIFLATLIIISTHGIILSIYQGSLGLYSVYESLSPTGMDLYLSIVLLLMSIGSLYLSYFLNLKSHQYTS
jgi:hypothetical protein